MGLHHTGSAPATLHCKHCTTEWWHHATAYYKSGGRLQGYCGYINDVLQHWLPVFSWCMFVISASTISGAADKLPDASVIKHFSFHGLLNPSNHQKPSETLKRGNLETYVPFHGNLSELDFGEVWYTPLPTWSCPKMWCFLHPLTQTSCV